MKGFVLGVMVALIALFLGVMIYTRMGFVDVAADQEPGAMEKMIMGGSVDPSVERHAEHTAFPMEVNDANLIQGMKVYQMNCALCHGGVDKKPAAVGQNLFPRAPQFIVRGRGLHDPGWFTFYQTKHGIRHTGMPAWDKVLADDDIWKVTMYLENLANLPPAVQAEIKQSFPNAQ